MTITGGTALSSEEIDRMVRDAESYADEDRKRRELAEARNQADQVAHQTDKLLKEQADQLTDDEQSAIEAALAELKAAAEQESATTEDIRQKIEAVLTASQALAQRLYAQAAQEQHAATGEAADESSDDDVVEAEIIEEGGDEA
jgi:molecular chaperone DnaK